MLTSRNVMFLRNSLSQLPGLQGNYSCLSAVIKSVAVLILTKCWLWIFDLSHRAWVRIRTVSLTLIRWVATHLSNLKYFTLKKFGMSIELQNKNAPSSLFDCFKKCHLLGQIIILGKRELDLWQDLNRKRMSFEVLIVNVNVIKKCEPFCMCSCT